MGLVRISSLDIGDPLFLSFYGNFAPLFVEKKLLPSRDSKRRVPKTVLISLAGGGGGIALVLLAAICVWR